MDSIFGEPQCLIRISNNILQRKLCFPFLISILLLSMFFYLFVGNEFMPTYPSYTIIQLSHSGHFTTNITNANQEDSEFHYKNNTTKQQTKFYSENTRIKQPTDFYDRSHQTRPASVPKWDTCVDKKSWPIEDLLCVEPPTYLPNYKNPCWYSGTPKTLKCIPYFMLIGCPKCASTDIFERIIKHPNIYGNNGVIGKEAWWWSWRRYGITSKTPQTFSNFPNYFKTFAGITEKGKDENDFHKAITGEGSSFNFQYFYIWPKIPQNKGLDKPRILTPHLIKHINPETKFVLILREPSERLYSHYYFAHRQPMNSAGFTANVDLSLKLFEECVAKNSINKCAFDMALFHKMKVDLVYSIYSIFWREWRAVFPREQFFIVRTEDYSKNITGTLKELYKFLGVDPLSPEELNTIAAREKKYQTKAKKNQLPMSAETKAKLKKFFAPFNQELATMLNDQKFLWNDV